MLCLTLTISGETLGNISKLEYLNLSYVLIEELPPQVGHQRSLAVLDLRCKFLKELPSAMGDLSDLEVLTIGVDSVDNTWVSVT